MLKLKLHYFGHLMGKANSLDKALTLGKTEGKRTTGWQRMRSLESVSNLMDVGLSKLPEIEEDRGAWCVVVHEVAKNWTQLNN